MEITNAIREEIRKAVQSVVYTVDATPRLEWRQGNGLEGKLKLIEEAT